MGKEFEKEAVQFSHSGMSDSLRPHGLQHARPSCPSSTPGVDSNSCPLSQWCHPTISSCRPLLFLLSIFLSVRVFSSESALRIRWPKSWSLLKLMSIELVMPSNHLILSSPSPPTFNLSQHQGLFRWVSSSHQVAKVLELQHQSFQWIFRPDFL